MAEAAPKGTQAITASPSFLELAVPCPGPGCYGVRLHVTHRYKRDGLVWGWVWAMVAREAGEAGATSKNLCPHFSDLLSHLPARAVWSKARSLPTS